jgi:hypothetical protein
MWDFEMLGGSRRNKWSINAQHSSERAHITENNDILPGKSAATKRPESPPFKSSVATGQSNISWCKVD